MQISLTHERFDFDEYDGQPLGDDLASNVYAFGIAYRFGDEEKKGDRPRIRFTLPYVDTDGDGDLSSLSASGWADASVSLNVPVGLDVNSTNRRWFEVIGGGTIPNGDEDRGLGIEKPLIWLGAEWNLDLTGLREGTLFPRNRISVALMYNRNLADSDLSFVALNARYLRALRDQAYFEWSADFEFKHGSGLSVPTDADPDTMIRRDRATNISTTAAFRHRLTPARADENSHLFWFVSLTYTFTDDALVDHLSGSVGLQYFWGNQSSSGDD